MTKVTFEDVFDGLQILPSREDTEGKFIDILEKQKELMEFAIANHSKSCKFVLIFTILLTVLFFLPLMTYLFLAITFHGD